MRPIAIFAVALLALSAPADARNRNRDRNLVQPAAGVLTLYSGPNLTGRKTVLTESIGDLSDYRFARRAASLSAVGNWQVCTEPGFRGQCQTYTGRVPSLIYLGTARGIKSVRYVGGR
jgi:hypothetical protein